MPQTFKGVNICPLYAAARIFCYPCFEYTTPARGSETGPRRDICLLGNVWGFNKWRLCLNEAVGSVRGNVRTLIKEIFRYMWLHADRMASYVDNSFRHAIMKNPADRTQQVRDHCCLDREHTRFWDASCVFVIVYVLRCYTIDSVSCFEKL